MKIFLIILSAALYSSVPLYGQYPLVQKSTQLPETEYVWQPDTTRITNLYDNGFGIRYSNISGYGVSIMRRFLEDYTVCLSGMIIYDQHTKWSDMNKTLIIVNRKEILWDIGIELQRDIFTTYNSKFYVLVGFYKNVKDNTQDTAMYKIDDLFSIGAGLGFQWFMGRHVASYFQFGYKFDNTNIEENKRPALERKTTIGYGIGLALLF